MFIYPVWLNLRIFWVCLNLYVFYLSQPMLSRHRFCCYMCLPNALLFRGWVRVTHFTLYRIYNFSILLLYYYISGLFLSTKYIGLHSVVDILVDFKLNPCIPGSNLGNRMNIFFIIFFNFLCFFFVIITTVQICKFNITLSTQILLLYYHLWCPGLQRLQRFNYFIHERQK